ncbi:MAG: sensor histidine kinase [Bacteroidetes bacterium]|nr:sensor histidine kinase [Bacteroidota bacterium]
MKDEIVQFKVSAGLKDIIGRDLISDDFIAVFELVKNSFDAHATLVKIIFEKDKLVIWDDGKGMTYNEITNKWLFVGYSAKKTGEEDDELIEKEFNDYRKKILITKNFAGAKGIGRFSCDRLGKNLTLTTKKVANTGSAEQLIFDWNKFEKDPKDDFTQVNITRKGVVKLENFPKFKHGTILEISNLRSSWGKDKILELKHSLEKLINPFETVEESKSGVVIPSFSIEIIAEEFKKNDVQETDSRWKVNGLVKNFIFEKLGLKTTQIFSIISEDGKFVTTELIDRGELIYKVKEKNNFSLLANIKYHLFYLNTSAKNNFYRQMRIRSVDFGSVFLYKNGIRIYPFGEEGKDSFGMDKRKAQGYSRNLGTREVIGRISLFGSSNQFHEAFKETSSRDGGLKMTASYSQMQDAFYEYCLKRLEKYVVDLQWTLKDNSEDLDYIENSSELKNKVINLLSKLSENKNVEILDYNRDLINILSEKIDDEIPNNAAFDDLEIIAINTKDRDLHAKIQNSKKEYVKLLKQKNELEQKARDEEFARIKAEENLALEKERTTYLSSSNKNLSDDAKGLVHNIKLTSKEITNSVESLIEKIREESLNTKELLRRLGVIKYNSEKVLKISKLITRSNFKTQANSQIIDIVKYTEQYLGMYSEIYDNNNLNFKIITNGASLERKISVLDLSLVFDDLISNAEKAGATKIQLECKNNKKKLELLFSDNGRGLDKKFWDDPEKIFELGITTTDGSGIGLDSVRKQLKQMHATIHFEGNGISQRGANFKIIFE